MTLQPCRVCEGDVAPRAKKCPHCGARGPTQGRVEAGLNDAARVAFAIGCGLILGVPLIMVALAIIGAAIGGR